MPARPALLATRRTALGGALLGLGATGCRLDRPADPAAAPSPAANATSGEDPDADLVAEVLAELLALAALTASMARRFPTLRGPARELGRLHRAHREALGDVVTPGSREDASLPRDDVEALALLRTRELRAQRRLVDFSVAAQSGALARLLASMSAGVAQQVSAMPRTPGDSR